MTFSARACQRHSTGQELIGSDEHLVAIWDLGNVILPCSSKLSFILTSCNNYETFWRSMWNDDFTDKTRQQSAIWLVLEPLTEQEGLARVCFLSSPAPTEWPRSPWKMHTGALGLIPPPHMGGPWQRCLDSFRQCWPLSHVPLLSPPPQVNMAHHTSLDVALVLRIYSAASHAHGHSWDLLPRALDLARPCCHCFSFIASAFPPGFAIASGADVAVQAPSMALESLQTNFFPLLWFIPEVPPQSTDRLFLWKCKVF